MTVTTYLDGEQLQKRTGVTSGSQFSVSLTDSKLMGLSFGHSHDIKIVATDSDGESSTHILRFSKSNTGPRISWGSGQGIASGDNINQNLGEINSPFSYTFRVRDDDGQSVDVRATLSSSKGTNLLKSLVNASQNQDIKVEVDQKLIDSLPLNEEIELRVTASDAYTSSNSILTFKRSNEAPVVITDKDVYQGVSEKLNIRYEASDKNEDAFTVRWYINGKKQGENKHTTSESGYITMDHLDFIKIRPGIKNTIRVEAEDDKGSMSVKNIYFYRVVKKLHVRGKFDSPMIDVVLGELYVTTIMAHSKGCKVSIKICNNANDDNPKWEDITHFVVGKQMAQLANRSKTADSWAIGFELIIEKGTAGDNWFAWFASMGASLPTRSGIENLGGM